MTGHGDCTPEVLAPAERIANTFSWWLNTEIYTSNNNQNVYLNDLGKFRKDGASKSEGHYNQLEQFLSQFAEYPTDLHTIARVLYRIKTGMSGAFRTDCFILANSQGDFMARRSSAPLSIDIRSNVGSRLCEVFGHLPASEDLAQPVFTADTIISGIKGVNDLRRRTMQKVHDDPKSNVGMRKIGHHKSLVSLQQQWLKAGVDTVCYAASLEEGELDKVIFMEPIPFTESKECYPFASPGLKFAPVFADRGVDSQLDG